MILTIVPVKPLHLAKARLAGILTAPERRALVLAMLGDVLATLQATAAVYDTIVISRDAAALDLAVEYGATPLIDQAADLNSALTQAAAFAEQSGATGVLALPADLPLITPAEITGLIATGIEGGGIALAPSRDGGTNGLYRPAGAALPFLFGVGSLARHMAAAHERGLATRLFHAPGLELDIDQPDDVLLLAEAAGETAAQQLARELCVDARLACV
jgi:2-phospho-L-lactate/phosphoenolpyruvate guanylyltransferase